MVLTVEHDALLDILPIMINMGYGRDVYAAIGTCKTFWEDKYIWQVVKDMRFGGHKATPMMHAAVEGPKAHEIIKGIMKRKGSLTAKDDDGSTPLFYAANANQPKTVKFLHSLGADIEEPDDEGMTPLMDSAFLGNLGSVTALLELGASTAGWDKKHGCSAFLGTARGYGHAGKQDECMALLLAHGADVNEQSLTGTTALMYLAKQSWSSPDMKLLLAAGANLRITDFEGDTALHIAVHMNNYTCTKTLLEAGANPNARCSIGNTPLHQAALNGEPNIVRLLLEAGADCLMVTDDGMTPMDYMEEEMEKDDTSREEIIEYRSIAKMLYLAGDDDADIPDEPLELLWLAEMDAIQVEEDPTWLLKAARLDRTEPYEYGWPMSKKETLIIQILRRGAHRWRFAPNLVIEIDNVLMKA